MVRERVKHWAGTAGIGVCGRMVGWPFSRVAWKIGVDYMARFGGREDEVEKEELEVPCEDEEVNEGLRELLGETHGCCTSLPMRLEGLRREET